MRRIVLWHICWLRWGADRPVAIGVLYCDPMASYEEGMHGLAARAEEKATTHDLNELLRRGHT